VTAYPLMLDGSAISALVVGGGRVATRKVRALLAAGAAVHVVAPVVDVELDGLAVTNDGLRITRRAYATEHLSDALVVIAATDDERVNAQIASDARARRRLVNVVSTPELGNFVTPAIHRTGDVTIAVTTGGVPTAATRIRDALARVIDDRYANAVRSLATLRQSLLDRGERDRWTEATTALIGSDFCEQIESGCFASRIAEWR
jgi:precorrin-2 dehydrogenase/sirohydrochlorin ferrochelatase